MSAVLLTFVMAWLASQPAGAGKTLAPGNHTFMLRHGARSRLYLVRMPRTAANVRTLPVVLAFHGGGSDANGFKGYAGLDALADREGFIVVYPYGTGVLPRRLLTWNAGDCCGYAINQRIDDVGFAIAVLDDLAKRTPIDGQRVYATGHSNGAMMAYRLAAERGDRIAAIAVVAGALNVDRLPPGQPVAVMHVHSVDDPRALYSGGLGPPFPGTTVRSSHRPVMDGLEAWRQRNGCTAQTQEVEMRQGTMATGGVKQTATLIAWDGCANGAAVRHWKLTATGHGWPGARVPELREEVGGPSTRLVNAAEEIWKFFATIAAASRK